MKTPNGNSKGLAHSHSRQHQAKAIFIELTECAVDRRQRLLDERCGTDSALRDCVSELLNADGQLLENIEKLAAASAQRPPEGLVPEIPGYRIRRLIAAGGTGLVYEAEQDRPQRLVAVKLIRPEYATRGTLVRFEREAELLARLRHPNVAQVYGVGSAKLATYTVPYIAMELVDGPSLMQYLAVNDLSASEKLRLLARVCEGVHQAHLQGIVHRDLKPQNILIDQDGRPHVVDFGIARLLASSSEATMLTQQGQVMGTLPYMSPEQAIGNIATVDARSDVYALGVIAFEVLSGERPFDITGLSLFEAIRLVTEREVPCVITDGSIANRDATVVVHKAMQRDLRCRYQSAHALRSDLIALADNMPVAAREPTLLYSIGGLFRRHKRGAIALAVVAVGFMVAAVTIMMLYQRQRSSTIRAERAELLAQDTTRYVISEVNQELQEIVGGTSIRHDLLRNTYERLAAAVEAVPRSRHRREDLAQALTMLGVTDLELMRPEKAAVLFREADVLLRELLAEEPDDRHLLETFSHNLIQLGNVLGEDKTLKMRNEQFSYYEQALRIDEQLVERFPEDMHLLNNLSWSYQRLGVIELKRERFDEAHAFFQQQEQAARRLVATIPEDVPAMDALYDCLRWLEAWAKKTGDSRASRFQLEARRLAKAIYQRQPRRPRSMRYESRRLVEAGDDAIAAGDQMGGCDLYGQSMNLGAELVEAEWEMDRWHFVYRRAVKRFVSLAEDAATRKSLQQMINQANGPPTRLARYQEIRELLGLNKPKDCH